MKIFFIKPQSSTFIDKDESILADYLAFESFNYNNARGLNYVRKTLQLITTFVFSLSKFQIVYCWFADYHSFVLGLLCRLFNKRLVIIVGGYETANLPEYNYGGQLKPLRRFCINSALNLSHAIYPTSDFLLKELKELNPKWETKSKRIYLGFDLKVTQHLTEKQRFDFITICDSTSLNRCLLKGIDRFVEVAKFFPNKKFALIGMNNQAFRAMFPESTSNILVISKTPFAELLKILQKSKVYLQLSRRESFGSAVFESIVCGCIPIVADIGGLPEIVSKPGLRIGEFDKEELWLNQINEILVQSNELMPEEAKKVVEIKFAFEKRKAELILDLQKLIS